jgi:D-serine deaminase-like pyridoxal phosphate-dependent protein
VKPLIDQNWERYRRAIEGQPLPAALVDLDAFEANADWLLETARRGGKTLRVASKSVRCPALLKLVLERGGGTARGLMTYTARETAFLAAQGFDDLLLAYPTLQRADVDELARLSKEGKTLSVAADAPEQLDALDQAAGRAGTTLRVTVDVDVAYRPFGGLHLGVRRSPLRTVADVVQFTEALGRRSHLQLDGILTYEAQIAGLPDRSPFSRWTNWAKRLMKRAARRQLEATRAALARALTARGVKLRLCNGGGTGDLGWASAEPTLTEVTAGSGLLDSQLFDYFEDVQLSPAAYFALQITRQPREDLVVCHSGGWVASGEAGPDRLPTPALPRGCRLLSMEGAGEVQTPVLLPAGVRPALGDPLFFRHAKAGELAEHVEEYLLVRGDRIEGRAPTYRGLGKCFG